jgi:hypothetical protein
MSIWDRIKYELGRLLERISKFQPKRVLEALAMVRQRMLKHSGSMEASQIAVDTGSKQNKWG